MKLGVIGQGFVGGSVYEGMKNYFETFTFDINGNCTESSLFNLIIESLTNSSFRAWESVYIYLFGIRSKSKMFLS